MDHPHDVSYTIVCIYVREHASAQLHAYIYIYIYIGVRVHMHLLELRPNVPRQRAHNDHGTHITPILLRALWLFARRAGTFINEQRGAGAIWHACWCFFEPGETFAPTGPPFVTSRLAGQAPCRDSHEQRTTKAIGNRHHHVARNRRTTATVTPASLFLPLPASHPLAFLEGMRRRTMRANAVAFATTWVAPDAAPHPQNRRSDCGSVAWRGRVCFGFVCFALIW